MDNALMEAIEVINSYESTRKDIVYHLETAVKKMINDGTKIYVEEQQVLIEIHKRVGKSQVMAGAINFAPEWIMTREIICEHDGKCTGSNELVWEKDIENYANDIS